MRCLVDSRGPRSRATAGRRGGTAPRQKQQAEAIAPDVVAKEGWSANDASCLEALLTKRLPTLWRRSIVPAEVARLKALRAALAPAPSVALESAITAALLTPQFWYRSELGSKVSLPPDGAYTLSPFEMASLISYTLTDGPPDAPLLAAAAAMTTIDKAVFAGHVERIASDKAYVGAKVAEFYADLFDHEALVSKASPGIKADVQAKAGALRAEAAAFVRRLVDADASFGAILSSPELPVSGDSARYYGRTDVTGAMRFDTSPAGRHAGLLTLPANLIAMSGNTEDHSFIHRGSYVLDRALCVSLGSPPADAAANAGRHDMVAGLSSREIKLIHSSVRGVPKAHRSGGARVRDLRARRFLPRRRRPRSGGDTSRPNYHNHVAHWNLNEGSDKYWGTNENTRQAHHEMQRRQIDLVVEKCLEPLAAHRDEDGVAALDKTIVLIISEMSDASSHSATNLRKVIVGGKALGLEQGKHLPNATRNYGAGGAYGKKGVLKDPSGNVIRVIEEWEATGGT